MQSQLGHLKMLAKRWMWLVLLGIVFCGGAGYAIAKLTHPVYQASALIFLNFASSNSSPYDSTSASLSALPTYAQLLQSPTVLEPVVAENKGLTLDQLNAMVSVQPQANTQLIEVNARSTDPQLAMRIANEVSQAFAEYTNTQFPATLQILPANLPTTPISPKAQSNAVIGALIGLMLALTLIVTFEWIDDHLTSPEEAQEILGLDTLAILPQLSHKQRSMEAEKIGNFAEVCRVLCASLNAAQELKPFKLVMVTSALPKEGKSTVAVNLASFLAMGGKRVLLVDVNFRHPSLDQHLQMDNYPGFSSPFLQEDLPIEAELNGRLTEIPTLWVLTTGVPPSNPTEMLQSPLAHHVFNLFKTSSQFDYIIFDAPPLLPVADAQILAAYVQATVLVIDASKTPRKILSRAKQVLNRTHTNVLGVVLNNSPWKDNGDIGEYLRSLRQNIKQPKARFKMPIPSQPAPVDLYIPSTPPVSVNGKSDRDVTMAVSQYGKDAKLKS
jgi:polysaccharide biosynthesis transport protein